MAKDDAWYRAQQTLHLIPTDGRDGVVLRTVFFTLIAWLPLVIAAWINGTAFAGEKAEPLFRHLGIHSRFLIALPALIFGERAARSVMKKMLPRFISSGLIAEEKVTAFRELVAGVIRLKNSSRPWVLFCAIIVAVMLVPETGRRLQELDWSRVDDGMGFGGWWYLCVSRPIFQIFLMSWAWRIVLVAILMRKIVKLGLEPVATHPDGMGGLGFIGRLPRAFVPLAFAMSSVLCSQLAHDIAWHGAHLKEIRIPLAIFAVVALLICFAPLLMFIPVLKKAKRDGLAEYGDLMARYNREVHRRWIEGKKPAEDRLLTAPELGPTTDINSIYDSIRSMRTVPFTRNGVLTVMFPVAIPAILVAGMEIPLGEMLMKIFKTII